MQRRAPAPARHRSLQRVAEQGERARIRMHHQIVEVAEGGVDAAERTARIARHIAGIEAGKPL